MIDCACQLLARHSASVINRQLVIADGAVSHACIARHDVSTKRPSRTTEGAFRADEHDGASWRAGCPSPEGFSRVMLAVAEQTLHLSQRVG